MRFQGRGYLGKHLLICTRLILCNFYIQEKPSINISKKKKKNYPLFYLTFYYNIVIQVLEIVRFYNHTRSSQMQRENLVLLLIPIINYPPTTINNQNSETSVKIHVQACFLAHLFAAGQTISSSSLSGSFV